MAALGAQDQAGPEWTLGDAMMDRHAVAARLELARGGGLDRDEQVMQPTRTRQPGLVGRIEHARGLRQRLLGALQGENCRNFFGLTPTMRENTRWHWNGLMPTAAATSSQSGLVLDPGLDEIERPFDAVILVHGFPAHVGRVHGPENGIAGAPEPPGSCRHSTPFRERQGTGSGARKPRSRTPAAPGAAARAGRPPAPACVASIPRRPARKTRRSCRRPPGRDGRE